MTSTVVALPPRVPRCKACGGQTRLIQLAYGESAWVWLCSTCERAYTGSSLSPEPHPSSLSRWAGHPLLSWKRTEIPPICYVRSKVPPTDAWGWFKLFDPSTTHDRSTRP